MKLSLEMLGMMKRFINLQLSAEDFSFDYPARLAHIFSDLVIENKAVANLLGDELPDVCADFEPDESTRNEHPNWYYSENEMRDKVIQVYKQAQNLV